MSNKKLFGLLIFIFFCRSLSATGPSSIRSEINPVSVNDKGEVLCRTRFEKNETGAYRTMDIEYGFCILSGDSVIQITTTVLNGAAYPDHETFSQHRDYRDSVFKSCFDIRAMSRAEHMLEREYGFKECNVKAFEKNMTVTLQEFRNETRTDLQEVSQKALHGAKGVFKNDLTADKVNIVYNFGHIIIINNIIEEDNYSGAEFDYPNPSLSHIEGIEPGSNLYDNCKITGVLFMER